MKPNHIFIFCDNHDEVAHELIRFGFIEGSSRIHPNQGTTNRKFYFDDFYFEILWVHNFDEVTNKITTPTKLYERSQYMSNDYSPFGLCVDYAKEDDMLFENCFKYYPTYLPIDSVIEVLTHENAKSLPWTFRWKADLSKIEINEPINFPNKSLLKIIFGIKINEVRNDYLRLFKSDKIFFEDSKSEYLKFVFNTQPDRKIYEFKTLPLIIEF